MQRSGVFIRTKRDWKQTYFYLVHSERNKEGLPRQQSFYLGKTLNLTAQQWATVLRKVHDLWIDGEGDVVRDAVRAYCKKHGLLLNTADGVRAGRKLIRQQYEADEAERQKKFAERDAQRKREDPEGARRAEQWRSRLKDEFAFGSAKVVEACTVLGLSRSASKEQVQAAFRNLARANHPDVGGDPAKFRAVVDARDVMLKHLGTTEFRA
jgi:hypothetical protein